MEVLIFGGTGFFGAQLAEYLHILGHEVTVADISQPRSRVCGISYLELDIRSPGDYKQLSRNFDLVVNSAAALPSYTKDEIYSTDVDGVKTICNWLKASQIAHFIHISSTAVYGPAHEVNVKESNSPNPTDDYSMAKLEGELQISESLKLVDFSWTILV